MQASMISASRNELASSRPEDLNTAIARMYSIGHDAENALDELMKSDQTLDYHRDFMHPQSSCGTGNDSLNLPVCRDTRIQKGHYLLSLENIGSAAGGLSWRAGSGSKKLENQDRGVELLVGTSQGDSQGVAAQHALIQFHPQSGVLMLCGVHKDKPVEYLLEESYEPILLHAGEKHVLFKAINRFKVGRLEFHLIFENHNNDESAFTKIRDRVFTAAGLMTPHPSLHSMPKRYFHVIGDAILHQSMNSGSFGVVSAAIDSRSGAPLAVKRLSIKSKSAAQSAELQNEISMVKKFAVSAWKTM